MLEKCADCKHRFLCFTNRPRSSGRPKLITEVPHLPTQRIFRVPNNEEGKIFMANIRKYLNTDLFIMKVYGKSTSKKRSVYFQLTDKLKDYEASRMCHYADGGLD